MIKLTLTNEQVSHLLRLLEADKIFDSPEDDFAISHNLSCDLIISKLEQSQ